MNSTRKHGNFLLIVAGIFCWTMFGMSLYGESAAQSASSTAQDNNPPGVPTNPKEEAAKTDPQKMDRVVATVNGEPIRESDVNAGLQQDAFGTDIDEMKQSKLERLIQECIIRQLLKANGVIVPEEDIDAEVARLRKIPPPASCGCCRYPSLDDYMEANGFDMKELRGSIANDLGFQKYMGAQWEREYPAGEARKKLYQTERSRIEKEFVKASHIFFKVFQNPVNDKNPDEVHDNALKKAQAAWERLQKGEKFESVAKEVSEDFVSAPNGGALGCIPANVFGKAFSEAFAALKPGEYSKPVETPWGFHIFRRELIGEDDILDVLKEEYMKSNWQNAENKAEQAAKVEEFQPTKTP